ncbi:WXG100-like domain-containing protein [Nocardia sp. NPDC055029]
MGIEIPDSLQWVAKYILGAGDWPEGDETAMRRAADAWTSMAQTLNSVDDEAAKALNSALTALSEGETHDALATYRDKLLAGDEAAFTAIRKWCEKQAELLDDGANDIEHTKTVIIGTMIVAAVEIGVALATSWTGIGAAAGVAARIAAQVAVRIAMKSLLTRMIARGIAKAAARAALRGAAFEALEEGGIDGIARTIQVANGDRSMDEFGWSDLGLATFGGAVGGAVGGSLGSKLDGVGDGITSGLGKLAAKTATGAATELGADLSAQVASAGAASLFMGQDFNLDIGVDTFTSAGAGGVQSALESSGGNGNSPAPTVPELGDDVPGDTDAPTTPAGTGEPGDSAPETTSPASTGDPGATSPASAGAGTPSAAEGNGTQPDGAGTPSSPGEGSPSTNPAGTGQSGDPASGTPSNDGPADSPNTPSDGAPSSPSDSGAPDNPSGTPNSPSEPSGTQPGTPASPGDSTPAPNTDSPATPAESSPGPSPQGDTTPTNPSYPGAPSTPSDNGNAAPFTPSDGGNTASPAPNDAGNTASPAPNDGGNTASPAPNDAGNTAPAAPNDGDSTAPTSTPSSGNPSTPASPATPAESPSPTSTGQPSTPAAPSPSPSSPDLPPADTPSTTQPTAPTTPTDSSPAQPNSTPPSNPTSTAPVNQPTNTAEPASTTPNPSTNPSTTVPGTTPQSGNPSTAAVTPTTPTPADPSRQNPSTDTDTTAAATTTAPSPTATTPTAPTTTAPPPTTAAIPSNPASTFPGSTPPIGTTPVTPPRNQPATTNTPQLSTGNQSSAPPRDTPSPTPTPTSTPATTPTPATSRPGSSTADTEPERSASPARIDTNSPAATSTTPSESNPATNPARPTDPTTPTDTRPTHNTNLTPQQLENANRARQARESLRPLSPENNQALQVNPTTGRPYLSASYPNALGAPVRVVRVTAAVTSSPTTSPDTVATITDRTQLATDHTFNQGSQFPLGDWLMVDVVPTTDQTTADLTIDADTDPTLTDLANTVRSNLGLPPSSTPTLTPDDIRQLGADISRADLARSTTPSWADQHTDSTPPPTDSTPTPETNTDTDTDTDTTVDLDAIHNQFAENTPAGVSHHRGDPTMGDLPHRVPADPTRFTADTHITPDGQARIGPHTLTPEQYGDLLRRSGWDGVTPIRLIGCDASSNGFADRLAQHLGVEVLAPTQAAWTDSNGNVFSTSAVTNPDGTRSPRVPPDGQWQTHHPDRPTTPHGTDPTPPGTTPANAIDAESAVDRSQPTPPNANPSGHNPSVPVTNTPPGEQIPFGDGRDAVRHRITPPRRVVNGPLFDPNNPDHANIRGTLRPDDYPLPTPEGEPTRVVRGETENGVPFTDSIYGDPPDHTTVRDYPPRAVEYPRRTGGTFTALRHEQHVIYPPDADGNIRSVSRSQVGDNVVQTESINGRHVSTEGVIRHDFSSSDKVKRKADSAESTAATNTGHEGVDPTGGGLTYDGGHASSYRTTLDRGLVNLFAQERWFNQQEFKVLETAIAGWPSSGPGRETRVFFETDPPGAVTPETVTGRVSMTDSNGRVFQEFPIDFSNRGGNDFKRKDYGIELKDFKRYDENDYI